jgi:branched-chain amino acid transport system permease protein
VNPAAEDTAKQSPPRAPSAVDAHLLETARITGPAAARGWLVSAAPLLAGIALAALLQFGIQQLIGPFRTNVLMNIGINVILAVSLNIVNGFTGQFSIGHAGFMAVGGYTAAAVTYYTSFRLWGNALVHGGALSGMPASGWFTGGDALFVGACLAGGVFAAVAGYLVGLPSLRLRGDYLAIVTLGFGEIVRVLLQQSESDIPFLAEDVQRMSILEMAKHLGGALGFSGVPFYTTLFWVWLFATVTLVVAYRLKESSYGRAFLSIREDEIAAEAMGVPLTRFKVRAFVLAAFFAGIAGGLFAHEIGTALNPRELGFMKSFDIVIMVVLGGMGSISGAALAATILTILPEILRNPPHVWPLGLAAIVVVLVLRRRAGQRAALTLVAVTLALEAVRAAALWQGINLAEYRMVLYALSLVVMMIVRPQGLFGVKEIWNYGWLGRRKQPAAPVR